MSLQQAIYNNITDNPIQRLENIVLNRQRGKWFRRIMYLLTALIIAIPIFWGFGRNFYDSLNFTLGFLVILNILVFVLVVIRAVQMGADSMYRERRNRTWELLMLTGVSNWRVVMGKWVGIMRHLVRDYLWLFVVRFGTIFWTAINYNLLEDYTYRELNPYYNNVSNNLVTVLDGRIEPTWFLIAIGFALFLTAIELAFSSAIGLSVAFFKFRMKTASVIAVAVRLGFALLIPAITYLAFSIGDGEDILTIEYTTLNDDSFVNTAIFAGRTSTFFADNGMISATMFADEDFTREMSDEYGRAFQLANLLGVLMYMGGTAVALGIATNRAFVRGLDYTSGIQPKVKSKRRSQNQPVLDEVVSSPTPKTATIAMNRQNVFNFDKGETLSVDIYQYQRRLGRMILRVASGERSPRYVQLSNVAYVDAPMFWKSANFRTGSDAEYQAFIQEKGIYVNSLVEASMRLYILDGKTSVKIVAGSAEVLDYMPESV
ncbi:MAG: ABC transporter permease subunit [Chloroflexota bacterium]